VPSPNWLVDPRGGTWGSFHCNIRTAWGQSEKGRLSGWLFPPHDDQPARVLLDDRAAFPAPAHFQAEDLVSQTRDGLTGFRAGKQFWPSAVNAAWLYRLGTRILLHSSLFVARGRGDRADISLADPGRDGAQMAFLWAVHAYMVRADEESLVHAERLAKLYPDYLDEFGPRKTASFLNCAAGKKRDV